MTIISGLQTEQGEREKRIRHLIIAIDGPAGTGKSTVAKLLAARLGCLYLDTGALYRAVAWKVSAAGINPSNRAAIERILSTSEVSIELRDGRTHVVMDGREPSQEMRTPEISQMASLISAIPAVRDWLLPVQRKAGAKDSVVAEGRDIGTRIFPQADVKFFLDADLDVRAARRYRELAAGGVGVSLEQTRQEVQARDERDRSRDIAPLRPAEDAYVIDTSALDVDQVLDRMMAVIAAKL
jgi:cytidylate kinase